MLALSTALAGSSGCVSKSKAQAQARMAYLAGQREAQLQLQQQLANPDITFTGPVTNSTVPWSENLTLVGAIVQAGYTGTSDPAVVIVRRKGTEIQIDPKRLLNGDDLPLQPGDTVELQP